MCCPLSELPSTQQDLIIPFLATFFPCFGASALFSLFFFQCPFRQSGTLSFCRGIIYRPWHSCFSEEKIYITYPKKNNSPHLPQMMIYSLWCWRAEKFWRGLPSWISTLRRIVLYYSSGLEANKRNNNTLSGCLRIHDWSCKWPQLSRSLIKRGRTHEVAVCPWGQGGGKRSCVSSLSPTTTGLVIEPISCVPPGFVCRTSVTSFSFDFPPGSSGTDEPREDPRREDEANGGLAPPPVPPSQKPATPLPPPAEHEPSTGRSPSPSLKALAQSARAITGFVNAAKPRANDDGQELPPEEHGTPAGEEASGGSSPALSSSSSSEGDGQGMEAGQPVSTEKRKAAMACRTLSAPTLARWEVPLLTGALTPRRPPGTPQSAPRSFSSMSGGTAAQ